MSGDGAFMSELDGRKEVPRILIAEGPWGIQEPEEVYGPTVYDQVTHKCSWKKNWFFKTYTIPLYLMKSETSFCSQCQEPVPNMIKTLWTLKNMDKIQEDAQYGNKFWGMSSFYVGGGDFYLNGTYAARPGGIYTYTPKAGWSS